LARSRDVLAIIAASMRLLLSAKQDLLRMVRAFRDIERGRFVNFGKLDLGSWGRIRNLGPHVPSVVALALLQDQCVTENCGAYKGADKRLTHNEEFWKRASRRCFRDTKANRLASRKLSGSGGQP
jgi:hypothetical protein